MKGEQNELTISRLINAPPARVWRAWGNGGDFKPHVQGCFLEVVPEGRMVWTTCLSEGWRRRAWESV